MRKRAKTESNLVPEDETKHIKWISRLSKRISKGNNKVRLVTHAEARTVARKE